MFNFLLLPFQQPPRSAYGNHNGANNAHHANAAHSQSGNHYDKDSYVHHEVSLEYEMYTSAYNPVLKC